MIEYVIERADQADASDWPIHKDRIGEFLKPNTLPSEVVAGWGDHRIRVAGIEVSFSWEPVGWCAAFEGEIDQDTAAQIVGEIANNLAAAVEGEARVVQISVGSNAVRGVDGRGRAVVASRHTERVQAGSRQMGGIPCPISRP